MVAPPPRLDSKHQELWHAACQLLQENMGLTNLSAASDNPPKEWQNSVHATRMCQL
jgi:hypothetical protein